MNRKIFRFALIGLLMAAAAAWAMVSEAGSDDPFASFPASSDEAMSWPWEKFAVYYDHLAGEPLAAENVGAWLSRWTRLSDLLSECETRLEIATNSDTSDAQAEKHYNEFLEKIKTQAQQREQDLRAKLLESKLTPAGFELPLKKMRLQAELFRPANLPLFVDEEKLVTEYNKILGAQSVNWEGKEVTLAQLDPVYLQTDRARREKAWRLAMGRWQQDRSGIGELWGKFLDLRLKIAKNAGFPDYRSYRWKDLLRLDYTPEEVKAFHENIRKVVVPAAVRIYERRKKQLGVDRLRPWDLNVDPLGRAPLAPFTTVAELENKTQAIFNALDPQLGGEFATMRREKTLDLDNRKNKAPGGFCAGLDVRRLPFIFMNAVGTHEDVQTIIHESGHSFHYFEASRLPWTQQRYIPTEFDEVAAMSMELIAGAHLDHQPDGFYNSRDAARARIENIEGVILFWPYMSVVDSFQHWVYENPDAARDPKNCDREWSRLWDIYMQGVDWGDLQDVKETGWQRKLHIHTYPFYYIEYGMAELGAVQVFGNALKDPKKALADYRRALSLGGTVSLPQLFAAAGGKFSLDEKTLQDAVDLLEKTIAQLEKEP